MIKSFVPAVLALACATSAQGACIQANIAGTWTAYVTSQDTVGELAWTTCRLLIDATGAFKSTDSTCSASGRSARVQGSLSLSAPALCAYKGSITINQKGGGTSNIPSLTLSTDKQTAMGAGGENGANDVFMISLVRIK
jgi:hypothetical protein